MPDPVVSPTDTIRLTDREREWLRTMPTWWDVSGSAIGVKIDLLLADRRALLAVGERDRQQIARLTAAYCDPKMWRETWLDNGASVWEFLCASDCDEPWNPDTVLAGEEDAGHE